MGATFGQPTRARDRVRQRAEVATIALVVFIGILHPDFLDIGQLKEVVQNATYVGIIAAGMAFLISMREIDLSVGSMFGLALVVSALLMQHGMNPWLAALLGVLLGGAMGLLNAILVQFIAIPAIVATLATLSMYRGLSQALSGGEQVTGLPAESSFFTFLGGDEILGLPVSVWVMIVVTVVLTAVLRLTPYGYRVRAIGSNPEAATFSGISIPRVRVQTLVLVGLLVGPLGDARPGLLHLGRPEHRHRVRAAGDRRGDHRRHPAARRQRDRGRRRPGRDPAERRQQRARLLRRAGQLEQLRDRRRDPRGRRARQPDPRPAPLPPYRA